jgi:hypothetical protein
MSTYSGSLHNPNNFNELLGDLTGRRFWGAFLEPVSSSTTVVTGSGTATTNYTMRAWWINGATNIFWTVQNNPDTTGASSGKPTNQLLFITTSKIFIT